LKVEGGEHRPPATIGVTPLRTSHCSLTRFKTVGRKRMPTRDTFCECFAPLDHKDRDFKGLTPMKCEQQVTYYEQLASLAHVHECQ
jgi:hypothetical protein